ncbi:DUF3891 family protein [Humitalea sp. 24SJ18S-53]|uniref:DUF3891 family protein n=1 Tax=Humitalea sp. 24SJ18S-53 TaxID=3422307 RepID=UPI003D66D77E
MLLRPMPDGGLLCVSQPAHALISGQLARAWGAPGFAAPAPLEPVALACAQHDVAWMGWEAEPSFDPATGRPLEFRGLGGRHHAPMWAEGVRLALASWGLWPALLISRHGNLIYRRFLDRHRVDPADAAAADAYLAEQAVLQAEWAARLGVTEAEVAANSAILGAVDQMSLTICWGLADCWTGDAPLADGSHARMMLRQGDGYLVCDPWPFREAEVRVQTEATLLAAPATYPDAAAMRQALAVSPRVAVSAVLRRA